MPPASFPWGWRTGASSGTHPTLGESSPSKRFMLHTACAAHSGDPVGRSGSTRILRGSCRPVRRRGRGRRGATARRCMVTLRTWRQVSGCGGLQLALGALGWAAAPRPRVDATHPANAPGPISPPHSPPPRGPSLHLPSHARSPSLPAPPPITRRTQAPRSRAAPTLRRARRRRRYTLQPPRSSRRRRQQRRQHSTLSTMKVGAGL